MPIMSLQQPGVTGNIGEGGSGAANVTANGENTPHAAVRRFRDIARLVSDWIWETDENFQLVFTSQRIMETLGYHPLELKGRTLSELGSFLSEDRKPIYLRWKKPFRNILYAIEDKTGTRRFHLISGVPVFDGETGRFTGVRGTARDITEQMIAEENLKKSEERYRTLYHKSPVMAYSTAPDGRIISVSDYWLECLGYEKDEVLGEPAARFIVEETPETEPEGDEVPPLEEVSDSSESPEKPCQFLKKNGERVDMLLYASAIHDTQGAVVQILNVLMDVTERKRYEASLLKQANFDLLTELPNRGLAMDRLGQAIVRARRQQLMVALMFVDLDNFKKINDTLGHSAGDELLLKVGEHLKGCVRESDTVARLGGDEFLVILPDLKSVGHCEIVAQKVLDRCARPFLIKGHEVVVTASIGVSLFPNDGEDTDSLIRNADSAMYRSKAKGKNTFRFFAPDMDGLAHEHLVLENHLRKALSRGELELRYQPIVQPEDGGLVGVEALVRWRHPTLGRIPPSQFIPLAEESGLINSVGEWILMTACKEAVDLRKRLEKDIFIAVNVSARQFTSNRPLLVDVVRRALKQSGLPPDRLELEITEGVILDDEPENEAILNDLSNLGIRLSIDDFGTGYSSLSYLKKFPFDTLKIDRLFVRDIDHGQQNAALASAIIAMAHALDLKVVGEGVENTGQLDFLRERNCDFIQGYHFSRPLEPEALLSYALARGDSDNSSTTPAKPAGKRVTRPIKEITSKPPQPASD